MAEIGSSYDLHGWAPPRRQEPAIVAPSLPTTNCPRCGRPGATVEEYDSTDQSGTVRRYRLIRCPEGQRVKARHAQGSREPKCQHTREELHVPAIDWATKARYKEAVARGGGLTLHRLEQLTGIPAKSISGAFAGSPVSPGRLETILRGLDQLEALEPSQLEQSEPEPGLDLRSQIIEAEATKSRRPYGRQRSAPPPGPCRRRGHLGLPAGRADRAPGARIGAPGPWRPAATGGRATWRLGR